MSNSLRINNKISNTISFLTNITAVPPNAPLDFGSLTKIFTSLTPQSTPPASPNVGDVYLDDGTNTESGGVSLRIYLDEGWADLPSSTEQKSTDYLKRDGSTPITANWDVDGTGTLFVDKVNKRVSIGTGASTPSARLEVQGETSDDTTAALHVKNASGDGVLYVRDDGRVGIGTTSPITDLDVRGNIFLGTGYNGLYLTDTGMGTFNAAPEYGIGFSNLNVGGAGNAVQVSGYYGLNFAVGDGNRLTINSTGNFGIGTTDPKGLLDVVGDLVLHEMTVPSAPPADSLRLFSRDDGTGKTQLCVMWSDGSITVLATQP